MRSFIAIELSDPIKDELTRIQSRLKYTGADVKWVERGNIHLTMKFLGEVGEDRLQEVTAALDGAAKDSCAFDMTIRDLGVFPRLDFPRVVWAGLDKGAAESGELAKNIDSAMEKLSFERGSRPFSPHITIGRIRSSKNKAALKEGLLATKIEKLLVQRVDAVILFKSELTSKGPIYTKVHTSPLS